MAQRGYQNRVGRINPARFLVDKFLNQLSAPSIFTMIRSSIRVMERSPSAKHSRSPENPRMPELSHAEQKFILHWGEMGARWGINRTVAQIHALLYLSPDPLTAEDIASTLSVARSNVSTSLKELQSWGLVSVGHVLGDRKDHYESMQDVWELFKVIIDGRKRREVDPTLAVLRQCVEELDQSASTEAFTKQRLQEMLEFFEIMTKSYEQARDLPKEELLKLLKLGDKFRKLFGV
jgi:DNA-binding transcriptional regulator GbsR (MarR family)